MGLWSFYFFAKLFLFIKGYIKFDLIYNIALAALLTVKIPKEKKWAGATNKFLLVIAVPIAIAVLWHDSWLPSPFAAAKELQTQGIPSKEYIYAFLMRYYDKQALINLGLLFAACYVANKFLKLSTLVAIMFVAMIPMNIAAMPNSDEIQQNVDAFFDSETSRIIKFKKKSAENIDFDIVVLHVCSLAWDDMKDVNLENDPFWLQFQIIFNNFNTATTYSGPSVIRLMRSNCGQPRHSEIYKDTQPGCYTFKDLSNAGYKVYSALNHDGKYGNFLKQIKENGITTPPLSTEGVSIYLNMFDNSPVYDDYQTLSKWWNIRLASKEPAALYYNTVSLHDGVHKPSDKNWWKGNRKEQFREYLAKMYSDVSKFFDEVQSSGRNVVVFFVPEHGLALRGSSIQAAGLRDIPLPNITSVPVGIKFIGPKYSGPRKPARLVSKPVSYTGLAFLMGRFMEKSPFASDDYGYNSFYETMPQSDFVAENEGSMVARVGKKYYFFGKDKKWIELTDNELQ